MKRNLIIFLTIVGTFLLQTTFRQLFTSVQATPNMLLALTACMGLMRGKKSGLLTGFFCGLIQDLFFGSIFGLNALLLMYIGYANGHFYKVFFDNDVRIPMVTVLLSDLAYNFVFFIVSFAFRMRFHFFSYLIGTIIPEAVFTMLCTIFLFLIYREILKRVAAVELEEEHSPWLRR
ncbi:MAG: rod shape-determining protein MreD [Eubacteriales bacterium]|nr:rod shape-determining protein MreD [Eubacteriales bacterium]